MTDNPNLSPEPVRRPILPRVALVTVVCAVLFATIVGTWAISTNRGTATDAHNLAVTIQKERRRASLVNCGDINRRHDRAVRKLDDLIADIPPGAQRDRARRGRNNTVLLIDALVPHRDCKRLAAQQVRATR